MTAYDEEAFALERRATVFQNSLCETPLPALRLCRDLSSKA
jgi:hypothetical protein